MTFRSSERLGFVNIKPGQKPLSAYQQVLNWSQEAKKRRGFKILGVCALSAFVNSEGPSERNVLESSTDSSSE